MLNNRSQFFHIKPIIPGIYWSVPDMRPLHSCILNTTIIISRAFGFTPAPDELPFDRPCADADIIKMAASTAHDDPFKFIAIPVDPLLDFMRD